MRSPFLYAKNLIGLGVKKLRFGSKFKAGAIQTFNSLKVEIHKGGHITLGSYDQNRGVLHLVADGGSITIGDHCFFNTGCCITSTESITIGNGCKFGNNLVIVDHDHNFNNVNGSNKDLPEFISKPITIGNNTWVGANVVILKGAKIGNNCIIGAGSIVTGDLPDGTRLIQKRSFN
jgi:acetyltransferase-like isoleucine patch superfamily enzyme